MKISDISLWEAFLAVAKHNSFSKASSTLRIPLPQLSKRVARLEEQLGVRLFQRTTRVVSLTDEGKALLPKITSTIEDLNDLETSFESRNELSGTLRVTCIPFIAHRILIPILERFKQIYPKIQLELDLSETIVNLIESNFDLAIRIQEPQDSSLVYRKLANNDLIFCASPTYLKTSKQPIKEPKHLHNHALLALGIHSRCRFKDGSNKIGDFARSKTIACENGWLLTELARKDFGILVRSILDVREYLESGELVQVLKNHPLESFGQIYAVIPSRRLLAPRVRVFLDTITEEFKTQMQKLI